MSVEHRDVGGIEHKRCSRCGEWQPLLHFPVNRTRDDGLALWCRECFAKYNRSRTKTKKQSAGSVHVTSKRVRQWIATSSPPIGLDSEES